MRMVVSTMLSPDEVAVLQTKAKRQALRELIQRIQRGQTETPRHRDRGANEAPEIL